MLVGEDFTFACDMIRINEAQWPMLVDDKTGSGKYWDGENTQSGSIFTTRGEETRQRTALVLTSDNIHAKLRLHSVSFFTGIKNAEIMYGINKYACRAPCEVLGPAHPSANG